jgi:hypothetical protein
LPLLKESNDARNNVRIDDEVARPGENGVRIMHAMCRTLGLAGLLASFAGVGSAAQVKGVLMDKMCSVEAAKKGQKFAASHDTKCALDNACQKSGYGVFTADDKFLVLDAAGNAKAAAALKTTKKTDNLLVTVEGDVEGDTIKVSSLKLN